MRIEGRCVRRQQDRRKKQECRGNIKCRLVTTMAGKGRELEDIMKKVDALCAK